MDSKLASIGTPTIGTIPHRLRGCLRAFRLVPSSRPHRRAVCSSTGPTMRSSVTSPRSRAGVPIVAGSVTSSSELRKRMIAQTRFRLFARGLEGFAPLAERSGYSIAESRTALISEQVLLRPRVAVLT